MSRAEANNKVAWKHNFASFYESHPVNQGFQSSLETQVKVDFAAK